ncbi:MAG: hypothetical protein JKX98_11960 [Alcanivoracaceae bacterium]|nr:hypothetical protein [Alcanivoracaceae bacterium]
MVLILLASSSWANKGWPWKTNNEIRDIATSIPFLISERENKFTQLHKLAKVKKKNIVIIGDVYGADLYISLASESKTNYMFLPIPYRCQAVLSNRPIEKVAD